MPINLTVLRFNGTDYELGKPTDSTPTEDSTNVVSSGGVYSTLNTKLSKRLIAKQYKKNECVNGILQSSPKVIGKGAAGYYHGITIGTGTTPTFIPLSAGESLSISVPEKTGVYYKYRIGYYSADLTYLAQTASTSDTLITQRSNGAYVAICVMAYNTSDDSTCDDIFSKFGDDVVFTLTYQSEYITDYISSAEVDEKLTRKLSQKELSKEYTKSAVAVGLLQSLQKTIAMYTHCFTVGSGEVPTLIPLEANKLATLIVPEIEGIYYKFRYGYYGSDGRYIAQTADTSDNTIIQKPTGAYVAISVMAYNTSDDSQHTGILDEFDDGVVLMIIYSEEYVADYIAPAELSDKVDNILNSADIISLNRGLSDKLLQALRPINLTSNGYKSVNQPLALAWISDIHADSLELSRFVQLINAYNVYLDDAICTGDLVQLRWSSGFDYWSNVDGAEKILLAVGNHDILLDNSGYDWTQRATQAQQYARYIEPFYSNWGISSDVSTDGLTYYYKDYTAKKIRLIVLNDMLQNEDNTTQLAWFESVLANAITNNFNVVVAHHCPLNEATKVDSNWCNIDKYSDNTYLSDGYTEAVDEFIGDGGTFLCWMSGHLHYDQIDVYTGTNGKQLNIGIDALNRAQGNQYSDTQRTDGTKSQDLINIIVFDTASECIKVIRVGADKDHYLRPKNVLAIKYDGTIVTEA